MAISERAGTDDLGQVVENRGNATDSDELSVTDLLPQY
jgi:hypothetical protein